MNNIGTWAKGFGQKYNHLIMRVENTHGTMGTFRIFFACGAYSDFIRDGYDYTKKKCPKCAAKRNKTLDK